MAGTRRLLVIGILVVSAVAAAAGAHIAMGATAGVKCPSAAEVGSTLNLKITTASQAPTFAQTTLCLYEVPGLSAPDITFVTNTSSSSFAKSQSTYTAQNTEVKTVAGIGNRAYARSVKVETWFTNLFLLKGTTEVQVSVPASLADTKALAKKVAASL